jgi:hypothetical protein
MEWAFRTVRAMRHELVFTVLVIDHSGYEVRMTDITADQRLRLLGRATIAARGGVI